MRRAASMMSDVDARLYQALHTGNPGDVDFYVGLCAGAASVLELGCGAGRVLSQLPVPERVGLDAHPGMIATAQTALPDATLVVGDMRAFELGRRFERIIIPYCGLYCVPDDAAVVQVLRCASRHLAPGGLIAFDGYQLDADPEELVDDDAPEWIATVHLDGQPIEVLEQDQHRPARRDCLVRYVFEGPGWTHEQRIAHHYQTASTIWDLLADAGLRCVAVWGDFDQTPVELGDRLVVIATHADG